MKIMSDVLGIFVDNDAESRLANQIALKARLPLYRSTQAHGASLDHETGIRDLVRDLAPKQVWALEIPGKETEDYFRSLGIRVKIFDHHAYRGLDRAHDAGGHRFKSSLEQFLEAAEITETDLLLLGFEPRMVRGIAIMDDRYLQGLRKSGYTQEEIERVLEYREYLERQVDPFYAQRYADAEHAFNTRRVLNGFLVYTSTSNLSVSRLVSTIAIRFGIESKPSIIFGRGGKQLFIVNITKSQIAALNHAFPNRYTWAYGADHCWGLDNEKSSEDLWITPTPEQLTELLCQA